jgi:hypothetical protein
MAEMLVKVRKVKVEEVKKIMQEVVLPVFESSSSNLVVTCAPSLEEVCICSVHLAISVFVSMLIRRCRLSKKDLAVRDTMFRSNLSIPSRTTMV